MALFLRGIHHVRPRGLAWAVVLLLAALGGFAAPAGAAATGKIQGKIVSADNGEPIGFADVLLIPTDSTLRRVGGMTNADGTFLLEAAPGRYTLQVRALSYTAKRIEGVVIEAGRLLPFSTALAAQAILQEEVVIEARARQNTESSMLAARRKAVAVGDAVSAEQVRKSTDKDAAEVLRRVTGLSVSSGKYVFVRGLGERYSSTEVDGVRIASPEQNKRVVSLDLLPASLLENVVIQKTYTADRPGEFGGGDVQVRTKDFPGNRTWSFSISQGAEGGSTFRDRKTYSSTRADLFGFGSDARRIPAAVYDVAGPRPLVYGGSSTEGFSKTVLGQVARSFDNTWTPTTETARPNGSYSATYGDEWKLFGRPLGIIESWSYSRSFDQRDEVQRLFQSTSDTLYDYAVRRCKETVQVGGISGLSYRLSPRHTLHLRGLYTNNAEDEVRIYEGADHNRIESTTDTYLHHRNTRLMYVQRSVISGTVEGAHEMPSFFGADLRWKFTRSRATRQQPDRREVTYDRGFYDDGTGTLVQYWALGSTGSREYGDLRDQGWGTSLTASAPIRLAGLGRGRATLGFDRQTKRRTNFYRRFNMYPALGADRTASPEQIFGPGSATGQEYSTGYVEEATLDIDNYRANQRVEAGFASLDLPLGRRLRANAGVRVESGFQDVRSFDLFQPARVTQEGTIETVDWLPSMNLTFALTPAVNVRAGASRTLSRPDLNEMSPSPALEYVGGFRIAGNPALERAQIDNYDLRVEAFPGLSEVLAAGFFYKYLHQPIEQVIQGGTPPILVPRNSDHGQNLGVELEARFGLGRLSGRLSRLALNANGSWISSNIQLKPGVSKIGTERHPLQGQADYLLNGGLTYSDPNGRAELSVLVNAVGKRLVLVGYVPQPDVYEQPLTSLDVAASVAPFPRARLKLGARNLLDRRSRQLQGEREYSSYKAGRSFSMALSYGS